VCAGSFRDLLDHGQSCAGCGPITFKSAFGELQQERLGGRDTALDSAFADGHHLPEHGLIGCFAPSPAAATGWIAALTLRKARRPWRPAITAAAILLIVGRTPARLVDRCVMRHPFW
jgi:hypothetical protein